MYTFTPPLNQITKIYASNTIYISNNSIPKLRKKQEKPLYEQAKRMKVFSPPNILSMLKNFYYAFNTSSKYCMGFKPIKNRFFFIDIFLWYNSITFKILKHHFLIMF